MRRPELENKILDYIKTTYNAEYKGLLEVHQDENEYIFMIGLPSYMSPTQIASDSASDDEFLAYIYEELRTRNYMRLEIYKVTRKDDSREE